MTRKTVCQQSTISWLTFGQTSQKNWVAWPTKTFRNWYWLPRMIA
jgi:hypothetical protein